MSDFADSDLSTMIDTDPRPSEGGGGQPTVNDGAEQPEPKAPRPPREDLEHVFREDAKKQAAEQKPAKDDAKPESAEDKAPEQAKEPAGKPAEAKDAPEGSDGADKPEEAPQKAPEAKDEAKPEGRRIDPPAKFLPDAKEHWRNTPRSVQRDIENMVREHESEVQRHAESTQRYERLKDFDDLAQRNGRDLRDSLMKVNQVENLMRSNPLAGINAMLMEIGPRKADGQPISLYEVAQHVVQMGPQGYQQAMSQPIPQQAQQRQPDPEVTQLKEQLAALQEQQLVTSVIDPFRAANPRYDELEGDIAFFLQSGKIPQSLSLHDRLSAAYDMAARINPASHVEPETRREGPDPDRRADEGFSGSKSIKSAPGSVSEEVEDIAPKEESIRDSILKAGRRLSR